ncbi:MAG: class I SAM-dependent methyltransferase [Rhizobacter sp.]|nr:class I SAM-dependent methyltransferase [Bacteriovorax sp.]
MQKLLNLLQERIPSHDGCARLLHGRGRKWPEFEHLSIDFYPPHVLITTYKEISDLEKKELIEVILKLGLNLQAILLQKRYVKGEAIEALVGSIPKESFAVENSEKYLLNLNNPQNIGFFLDMAVGRSLLKKISKGKSVLNLFSYTCSLSIAALKGEAREVVNVDMSKSALKIGGDNHTLNGIDKRNVKFMSHDIMKSFGNLTKKGPYDLVIIDPPTNQGLSFRVDHDYHKIIRRLDEMTSEDAVIMACLNSPFHNSSFLISAFSQHAPKFTFQEKFYSSFNEMEVDPEKGLKILLFKKEIKKS